MKVFSVIILSLCFTLDLFSQLSNNIENENNKIEGTVISRMSSIPIEGVEIYIDGLNENYYTNALGEFSIPYSGNEVWIVFTYPNYSTKEILYAGNGKLTVVLSPEKEMSMDSKLPGFFGEVDKYKNNSYSYLSGDQGFSKSESTPGLFMQGKLSGLSANSVSGLPGEGAILNIRGISSLFANQIPLIIVDGMPFYSQTIMNEVIPGNLHNPLKSIDVQNIQKIEILKDGGSLYGVRGSNGVILITTRQPEGVNTRVNFSAYTGVNLQPENQSVLNASQYKTYLVNQLQNSGMTYSDMLQQNPWVSGNPNYFYYYNYNNETDWQDQVFRPAYTNKFNVSLEGGDEIARFAVLLGYLNEQGIVENTGLQRFNFRLNSDIRIIEKLSMISNVGFSYTVSDLNNFSFDNTLNPISSALTKGPIFGPYLRDNEGNKISIFSNSDEYGLSNPAVLINKSLSNSFESNFFTNLKLLYQISQNLSLSNTINVSFNNIKDNSFIPDYGITDFQYGEFQNSAIEGVYKNFTIANESKVKWYQNINQTHFLHTEGGLRLSTNREVYNIGEVFNTPTDEFRSLSSVSLIQNTFISGFAKNVNYSDIFLYNGYRFRDKYLVDVVLTLSGSSNTGVNAEAIDMLGGKWGFFPSVHLGWLISNESFMKSMDRIDLLKLRASYSVTGNDFYSQQSKYYYVSRTYGLNSGLVRASVPNQALKWEDVHQLNAGIDIQLFNESVRLGLDVYSRTTNNLLSYKEIPDISGFQNLWENNGSLTSRGTDFSFEVMPLKGELQLKIGGNFSVSKSEVTLDHDIILDVPGANVIIRNGESAFSFYGLETDGLYSSNSDALSSGLVNEDGNTLEGGDIKFKNLTPDNVIDKNDRAVLGNIIPDMRGGLFISLKYKALRIYALGEYSGGNKVFNFTRSKLESMSGFENQSIAALYAWKNENDVTDIPRIAYDDPSGNSRFSDRWIEDGKYMRLREITLSYDLPPTGAYKNLRIYLTAKNLFTFSNYLGYYPEFAYSSNPAFQGIDYGQVPVTPQILIGLNIGF
jgi:TonB-linked SusC/RagA family outer membrane protein